MEGSWRPFFFSVRRWNALSSFHAHWLVAPPAYRGSRTWFVLLVLLLFVSHLLEATMAASIQPPGKQPRLQKASFLRGCRIARSLPSIRRLCRRDTRFKSLSILFDWQQCACAHIFTGSCRHDLKSHCRHSRYTSFTASNAKEQSRVWRWAHDGLTRFPGEFRFKRPWSYIQKPDTQSKSYIYSKECALLTVLTDGVAAMTDSSRGSVSIPYHSVWQSTSALHLLRLTSSLTSSCSRLRERRLRS